ncbi:uncharacterized protein MYCGRDRAFT_88991 [Zymoseptoria tritici IPO323]|uniref:Uncharacterized protein n=1 Tax=Zymoseptoria tritici (strain CBS 115943 / IPO323) TaxID=336722 RepID=F9WZS7_ZYMTI|nr:uncharacterized protein MYCGRDRAFT_88991 [Zymoseptoria tritici IPO323]EGP92573.1 hypothetical protein MYCGRDRAFT_88991 [Zymoseptoria tritici IPO323]
MLLVLLVLLALLGLGFTVFCYERSRRAPAINDLSESPSDSLQAYQDDPPPFFPDANEQTTEVIRCEELPETSLSESSLPRDRMHSQQFELGSPVSTSSEEESVVHFTGLDDPFSDTAFISSLGRSTSSLREQDLGELEDARAQFIMTELRATRSTGDSPQSLEAARQIPNVEDSDMFTES